MPRGSTVTYRSPEVRCTFLQTVSPPPAALPRLPCDNEGRPDARSPTLTERNLQIPSTLGGNLATIVASPVADTAAKVLLLHGFSSGKNNKTNLALQPHLLAAGLEVVRFDFWGHYDSDGDIADTTISLGVSDAVQVMNEIDRASDSTNSQLPWLAFGSSYGGSVLLGMLGECELAAAAYRSPVSDYVEMRRLQLGDEGLERWESDGDIELPAGSGTVRLKRAFLEDARTLDLYATAAENTLISQIVHGTADEEVPVEQSRRLIAAIGPLGKLVEVPGADHGYSRKPDFDTMVSATVAFLCAQLR